MCCGEMGCEGPLLEPLLGTGAVASCEVGVGDGRWMAVDPSDVVRVLGALRPKWWPVCLGDDLA